MKKIKKEDDKKKKRTYLLRIIQNNKAILKDLGIDRGAAHGNDL